MKLGTELHGSKTMNTPDFGDPLKFPLLLNEVNICGAMRNVLTAVGWIALKCGSDIHIPLRMN